MSDLCKMLEEEIKNRLNVISLMEDGSEEKKRATDEVVELYKIYLEERKPEEERERTSREGKNAKSQVLVSILGTVLGVVAPLGSTLIGNIFVDKFLDKGLKYESTGVVTSKFVSTLINHIRPGK